MKKNESNSNVLFSIDLKINGNINYTHHTDTLSKIIMPYLDTPKNACLFVHVIYRCI